MKQGILMESILAHLRLQQYKQTFQKHNVDFVAFLEMNEQSLKNIGIKNDQHINILVSCVVKLKAILTNLSGQMSPTTTSENRENKIFDELYLFETMKVDLFSSTGEDLPRLNGEFLAVQDVTQDENGAASIIRDVEVEQSSTSTIALQDLTSTRGHAEGSSSPKAELTESSTIVITIHPESGIPNNERSSIITRLRRHTASATDDVNIIGKSIRFKNQTRHSVLKHPHDPPSYYDSVERLRGMKPIYSDQEEEDQEKLPSYSCTVEKKGYIVKKNELTSHRRANDRSWKKHYIHLCGTLIKVYKSEPADIKYATPLQEFSMDNANISLATNYSKRRNVIRIKFSNGYQCLIQTSNRDECMKWVESLQTAVNISSTIDDRKMPQFVTAPNRRRRSYGYYAEMARELQQVPFDELDEAQALNW